MKRLLILCMLISPLAYGDEWSKTDIALESVYATLHTIDYLETRQIARNDHYYESINPILGKNPSQDKVDIWFCSMMAAQYIIADRLPSKWRKLWISSGIVVEGSMVRKNIKVGMKIRF